MTILENYPKPVVDCLMNILSTHDTCRILTRLTKNPKNDYDRTVHACEELSKKIGINVHRIESFDNSHLFGNFKVSGMVVFVDGKKICLDDIIRIEIPLEHKENS